MLPTFIVIGAMKAGTSSLHRYVGLHPEIGMSRDKELNYFKTESDFEKGIDWYASQFPEGYRVRGESSPTYSMRHLFPGVAERLYSVLPEVSLIYLVRHPADRAVSQYVHQVGAGKESRPIEAVFEDLEQNEYVLTGRYMFQLRKFLRLYPEDRLLVVDTADLRDDRARAMSRIFRFLRVDDGFYSEHFDRIYNDSSSRRRPSAVTRALCRLPGFSRTSSRRFPNKALRKITGTIIRRPVLPVELAKRLLDYYEDDIRALEQFAGRNFPAWREPSLASRCGSART